MPPDNITARRLAAPLVLAGCAAAIAACGSAGAGTTDRSGGFAQAMKFSACVRAHGLPNFPDPRASGGGIQLRIGPGTGITPFSPAFKAAQTACRKLMPGFGPSGGPVSSQARAQLLATARCMRAHGITAFPDPTTVQPSSPGPNSLVLGRGGVFLVVPSTINPRSPAFRQAASACHFGPRGGPT